MERTLVIALATSLTVAACAQKADNVVLEPSTAPAADSSPAVGAAESTSPGTTADDSHGYQQGNQVGMEADFGPLPARVPPREPAEPTPGR